MTIKSVQDLRLLVVEDNAHFRELVRTVIRALGVTDIVEATEGGEALARLRESPADIAIVDWKMQGMDGFDFMRALRDEATSPAPFLPVILVTGYMDPTLAAQARDAGVNEVLAKPISAKSLLARVRSVLEKPRAFVRTDTYFGPDRRRRQVAYRGPERRQNRPRLIPVEPGQR